MIAHDLSVQDTAKAPDNSPRIRNRSVERLRIYAQDPLKMTLAFIMPCHGPDMPALLIAAGMGYGATGFGHGGGGHDTPVATSTKSGWY